MTSNRSPSPLTPRNCRNSEAYSTTRRSFSGNPFARPNSLINPNPERNSFTRKSIGSMFQDGKENHKDAKFVSKNFMAPTISAASKFTPSPRKKILGEKNDVTQARASIEFLDKDSDFKSVALTLDQTERTEKEVDSDLHLPPYDPKKNLLLPRPRFLQVEEQEQQKEAELDDDLVHGSSGNLPELVLEEKPFDLEVEKLSKPRVFTRSKTVWFVFVLSLVACFSLSFTDSMDLPIYEDVGFLEINHGTLRFAAFAKESFDDLVETVKQLKSHFIPTHKIKSLQFFNLTSIQEEFQLNRHIGADYIQEIQELEEEIQDFEEEIQDLEEEIQDFDDEVVTEEPIHETIQSDGDDVQETKSNLDEAIHEAQSEMVENDVEIESSLTDFNGESEASSSLSTQSITTICVVAGFLMVVMAVSTVFYLNKKKSNASKSATIRVDNTNMRRESSASSSSDFSMGSHSLGSFTTYERIATKHKDEVMLTPIRRSSRLMKNQANV
ncbi:hypothetical protein L1987_14967 [Smallanthus sonchifolius]|uniref:Uncharacterized protein n=1 Tax=Smallanthus sonchifolius TaxID=185202 RepID=A0ACB9J471_9ASTR|nr:hypothetical protein L1987_14967 [Smallanthus sonchifolius]